MNPPLVKGSKHASDSRILLPLLGTQRNPLWSKAANMPQTAGVCCFCLEPKEIPFGQRQQTCLRQQEFAAFAWNPKKSPLVKGSKHALASRSLLLLAKYFFPLLR